MPVRKDIIEQRLFEDHTSKRAYKDVFEQIIVYTISDQYMNSRNLIESLVQEII